MAKLLESQGAIFQELSRSSRNGKLVVFIVADEPYQLMLMKSQVVGELTSAQCTGHLLQPVPGLLRQVRPPLRNGHELHRREQLPYVFVNDRPDHG